MTQRSVSIERLDAIPVEMREHVAENMKERIYATITLLAVMSALWQAADHHTVLGVIASIGGTAVALWLATLISARVSYRAVYGESMGRKKLARLLFTSSGLYIPVIIPTLFILVSSTGMLSLRNALLGGIVALLLSLFTLSFVAGRRIYTSMMRVILISILEMLLGVGVIALKLAVGQ